MANSLCPSITSTIVLLALCPLLALSAASPAVLSNANRSMPPIDGLERGDSSRHPFLAPVTPHLGARDAALRPQQDAAPRSDQAADRILATAGSVRDRGIRVKVVDGYGPDSERTSSSFLDNNELTASQSDQKSTNDRTDISNTSDAVETSNVESSSIIRGIMENFADDFESPPDSQLADDIFNREPYYYDVYYDTFDNNNQGMVSEMAFSSGDNRLPPHEVDGSQPAVSATAFGSGDNSLPPHEVDGLQPAVSSAGADAASAEVEMDGGEDDVAGMQESLDLRLLGADLQSELGFVLQQLTNGSQRNRRHQTAVRHHDPRQSHGISVGLQDGACPPPVHSLPPGLCGAPPCTSHMMCYPQKMCCFNGCTYTCTEAVRPPPVIDWLEDTGSRQPLLDPLNPALPLRFESSPLSYGTGGEETVSLPGGCTLSATKYAELKEFMTAESIQDCLCSGGEVVCVVKSAPSE